ncbi:lipopolysaccharide-induced tumor necrosis factor-alpha factor homolog [Labrus mixtus]|uniref:lipopolysaccharide-induced tumor necrosis factor-alpha factor homolog n=1 Tax=Labrus mixtus TaxID=508554 RepID=UPI0029C000EC|nr:lipopolysaccharide-induced tumor necrosis factor-alpha factor homolog [Labrus mixtus]
MTSPGCQLKEISTELNLNSLKTQQLLERKKILCLFLELRNRAEFEQTEESASNQKEIIDIDEKLNQLAEGKAELQKRLENIHNGREKTDEKKEVSSPSGPKMVSGKLSSSSNIFYVVAPPNIPAPKVHLDLENLPPCPCRTQCPECQQFVTTETFASVSSVTWLMCFMIAMVGCVAGCCLIPFCNKKFQTIVHRCPSCRTQIQAIKRL